MRKLLVVSAVLALELLTIIGCDSNKLTQPYDNEQGVWIPTVANLEAYPFRKRLMVADPTGQHHFSVDLRSYDSTLVNRIAEHHFLFEVLPVEPAELEPGAPQAGIGVDERVYAHDQLSFKVQPTGPPPLFFKVHYEDGEEPSRFRMTPQQLPVKEYAAVVNAGHYKSIVLRRSGSGSSYVQFYHHHGDWNSHLLYQGWFSRCTYAYDCLPNHSIPSWRTSRGDESIEYRDDCYGRCP